MMGDCGTECSELMDANQTVYQLALSLSEAKKTLKAVRKWSDSLGYAMSPEEWVQKMGDLNDILGLNPPIHEQILRRDSEVKQT